MHTKPETGNAFKGAKSGWGAQRNRRPGGAMSARLNRCYKCRHLRATPIKVQRRSYCSRRCAHDDGYRGFCWNWKDCGCTGYSKKRRLLREHRDLLRIAEDVLNDHDLTEEYEERAAEETSGPYSTASINEMDEESDAEDPELALRTENMLLRAELDDRDATQQAIALATASLDRGALVRELTRARMEIEDLKG